jgi:mannose-6-phosphate isomerase-like protein (cupin superfamily)
MIAKENIFSEVNSFLNSLKIKIKNIDDKRPWGGFFVIEESNTAQFIDYFFPTINKEEIQKGKLSPKILMVAPNKKLSWQYHFRRSEIWKLIKGEAAIIRSETDFENDPELLIIDDVITLKKGERHRLVGLSEWGIVAEIWIHTDANNPSDENDIIRINDEFGRK